jgi:DNA-binding FadR family transcriptional regulator
MQILMADIARGDFRVGDCLPSEAELAEQFAASRGVVREALRSLEERSVVRVRHGRGAVVSPARDWNLLDADVLAATIGTAASPSILGELLEVRRILEIEAAGLAAERAGAEDLTAAADALARMTTLVPRAERSSVAEDLFHEADVGFHNAVVRASGNRILARVVEPIQRTLYTARRPLAHPEVRAQLAIPEHKAILSGIASRDPNAAREAMRRHLDTIAGYLDEYARQVAMRASEGSAAEIDFHRPGVSSSTARSVEENRAIKPRIAD